ncbi:MAG TPA: hypothetical protein VMB22_05865 [Verrucomicrobiae bacterium]|nr:hypothetical protein [Verrucomicrobiae bacterium]
MRCDFRIGFVGLGILIASFICFGANEPPGQESAGTNNTWLIEATPLPATVSPGDHFKLTVAIKNITGADQTIDVPNYAWWAHSDNSSVIFQSWPRSAGLGPVVTFKTVTVAAGKTYTNSWSATVAPVTPAGDLTFRMGFPLYRDHRNDFWSVDIKLHVGSGK